MQEKWGAEAKYWRANSTGKQKMLPILQQLDKLGIFTIKRQLTAQPNPVFLVHLERKILPLPLP